THAHEVQLCAGSLAWRVARPLLYSTVRTHGGGRVSDQRRTRATPRGHGRDHFARESVMMNIAFILSADVFRDTYGEECFNAVAALGRVLGPPMTAEELAITPPSWLGDVEVLFTGWTGPRL